MQWPWDGRIKKPKSRHQGTKQEHNPGPQESEIQPVQGGAWKNPVGDHAEKKRGLKKSWLIFKITSAMLKNGPSQWRANQRQPEACINEQGAPDRTQIKSKTDGSKDRWPRKDMETIFECAGLGKTKSPRNCVWWGTWRASTGLQSCISTKRKARENTGLLLSGARDLVTKEVEEADVLKSFFAMVFTSNTCLRKSQIPEINLQKQCYSKESVNLMRDRRFCSLVIIPILTKWKPVGYFGLYVWASVCANICIECNYNVYMCIFYSTVSCVSHKERLF